MNDHFRRAKASAIPRQPKGQLVTQLARRRVSELQRDLK